MVKAAAELWDSIYGPETRSDLLKEKPKFGLSMINDGKRTSRKL